MPLEPGDICQECNTMVTGAKHRCPPRSPTTRERIARIFKECSGVWGQSGISSWERDRLEEWRSKPSLSEKQEAILRQIEKKAFPGDDE